MEHPARSPYLARADAMDVLVTGGAGFIGSHVVDRLLAEGHRPRIFDIRSSPHHDTTTVDTVRGDLMDLDELTEAMHGCDAVIHLAAAADVGQVQSEPVEAEQANARGTLHVLEAARRAEVGRVVYASTIWVYSDTDGPVVEETMALKPPAHLYTATKLAGELYCRSYQELYGLEHVILRFGIPYGPRARPAAVIPAFVTKALAGEPLTVAGDGSQSRRFVYVEDLADGVVSALVKAPANRVYNLVGNEDVTIAEIATTVRDLVGDVDIVRTPGRTGDFAGAPVSSERAARELGWSASTPFAEGVRRYLEWHREDAGALEHHVPARARPGWLPAGALLRRGGLAFVLACVVATMVLGLATLLPVDGDLDQWDLFGTVLLLFAPVLLAAGFEWGERYTQQLRKACWIGVAAALAPILLPWPPLLDHVGDAHPLLLGLTAFSAALSALSISTAPRMLTWLATSE